MIAVVITGNLGGDPELRFAGQTPVLEFRVASNGREKIEGEWQDTTTWVRVVVWGKRGEDLQKVLRQGSSVAVRGVLALREWTTREGEKRATLECKADDVDFAGRGSDRR